MANLQVHTLPLPNQGMMTDAAQDALPDHFCFYAQDMLFDVPGKIRSRGPLANMALASLPGSGNKAVGITSLVVGQDDTRVMIVYRDATDKLFFSVYQGETGALKATFSADDILGGGGITQPNTFLFFDAKPAMGGGKLISIVQGADYSQSANRPAVLYWRGASKLAYSGGGGVNIAYTNGSPTITGTGTAFLANVEPGMFLMFKSGAATYGPMGVVKTINSNTSITLESNVPYATAAGQNFTIIPARPLMPITTPWRSEGEATSSTTSTTVTGGNTKWQDVTVAGQDLFRKRDLAYVGTINTVNSNISLTLAANALIALNGEDYIIKGTNSTAQTQDAGYQAMFSAFWRDYQWLANWNSGMGNAGIGPSGSSFGVQSTSATVWLRGPDYIDEGDPTNTGSFIRFEPSTTGGRTAAIVGLGATKNALLVFFGREVHAITGNNPDDFTQRFLYGDGLLSPQSLVSYKDGVIWAGYDGVYYYDGISVNNLTNGRIENYYQYAVSKIPTTDLGGIYGTIVDDHYMLSLESAVLSNADDRSILYPQTAFDRLHQGKGIHFVFNMQTGAVGTFANVVHRGAATAKANESSIWMLFNKDGSNYHGVKVSDAKTLFVKNSIPSFVVDANVTYADNTGGVGPFNSFPFSYLETKIYDFGNPELKKLFRQIQYRFIMSNTPSAMIYNVFGGTNRGRLDQANPGVTNYVTNKGGLDPYDFENKRNKFLIRDTHLGIRLMEELGFELHALAIAYKPMRPGRV